MKPVKPATSGEEHRVKEHLSVELHVSKVERDSLPIVHAILAEWMGVNANYYSVNMVNDPDLQVAKG